jgi:predicted transposase/invertase (TIGR01784 family)
MAKTQQKIHTPHDKAFKQALLDVRIAKDFFKHYLPEKIRSLVNLDLLTIQDRTFISKELQATAADMLYQTTMTLDGTRDVLLYLLIEQQTQPDKWLPLRLLQYVCSILDSYRKQNPHAEQLPLVLPLIFYTGESAYSYSTDLFDLFSPAQDLAKTLFLGPYQIINLRDIPDEEIRKHQESGLMEMLMKHVKHRDALIFMREAFETFLPFLLADNSHDNYVSGMLHYALDQSEVQDIELFLMEIHCHLSKPVEEKIMTIAEQLIQKGELQGMQKGIQQGMQQGMQQGKISLLARLLKFRFGDLPHSYLEKMQKADEASLLLWGENLLQANSLDEIFE